MSEKIKYGIKVSKRGFSVTDLNREKNIGKGLEITPHIEYALALPYLYGANTQLARYQHAATSLEKRLSGSVLECIHEASTLFEDLCTVAKYAEKCGDKHKLHELWFDVRNHIRHDIREELDDEKDGRKRKRAERLKINDKLQTSIGFSLDLIKVGETEIYVKEIASYLSWADKVIGKVMKIAKKNGQIS